MPTATEMINACASELNRDDLRTDGAFAADSKGLLNDTMRDLFNRYTFSWRVKDPPISMPAAVGQKLYTVVAAQYQDIYTIILDTTDSTTRPLIGYLLKNFLEKWANVDYLGNSIPTHFAKIDQYKFYVAPRPDSSDYTFKIFYTTQFADITDFTVQLSTECPPRIFEVIKLGLLARLYRFTHEFDTSGKFFGLYETQILELIDQDKKDPSQVIEMEQAVFGDAPIGVDYWKSPFIHGV